MNCRIFGAVVVIAAVIVACGPSETSAPRARNTATGSASLINGKFVAGGGGWQVAGSPAGAGCKASGGAPSLGVWKKDALAFGYRKTTVSQGVVIPNPSTVVLTIAGAVRDDQRDAKFVVDLRSSTQVSSTGEQTGSALVIPQTFTLTVSTSSPNELVTVSATGSSSKFWAGCYGPILSNATLVATPTNSPIIIVGPSTTVTEVSTTIASTPSSSVAPTSTTVMTATTSPVTTIPVTALPATTIPATTIPSGVSSTTVVQTNSVAPFAVPQCVVADNANCSGTYWTGRFEINGRNATGVNFSNAVFAGSNLGGVALANSDFHQADLQGVVTWGSFVNGNFVDANLNGLMIGADFEASVLSGTRPRSDFASTANFTGADFSYAQISGAQLQGGNFSRAVFTGANLSNSSFFAANLDGADLRTADLKGIRSGLVTGKPLLPREWTIESGYLVGPGADLSVRDAREYMNDDRKILVTGPSASKSPRATCPIIWERSSSPMFGQQIRGYGSLSGKNFSNRNLAGINWTGVDLRGALFRGAKLNGAVFSAANLDSVDFSKAEMQRVALDYATLKNTNFVTAQWADISSGCTSSVPTSNGVLFPEGWKLDSTASLVVAKTFNPRTRETRDEQVVVRHGLILGRTANLTGANLIGLDLRRVDLSRATLTGVRSASVGMYYVEARYRAQPSRELPTGWAMVNGLLVGPDADLSYADLSNLDLRGYPSLANASLAGAFSISGLRADAPLPRGWVVADGRLVGPGANLYRVQFGASKLSGTDLDGADLSGADLSRAELNGVRGRNVFVDRGTRLPVGWKVVNGTLFGPTANLDDVVVDFRLGREVSNNFTGVDLRKASLKNVQLSGVTGSPQLPPRWKVVDGYLVGPTAVVPYSQIRNLAAVDQENLPPGYVKFVDGIAGPNMSFSRLTPRELTNVDISGSSFVGSDLRSTRMTNVRGENLNIIEAGLPAGWRYAMKPNGGVLVGPSANLSRIDLSFVDLTNIDLSRADLTGARGRFVRVNQDTRLPRGWRVVSGLLLGPTADLSGANLSGLDLSDLELSGATFTDVRGTNIGRTPRSLPDRWTIINDNLVGPTTNLLCTSRTGKFACKSAKLQYSGVN